MRADRIRSRRWFRTVVLTMVVLCAGTVGAPHDTAAAAPIEPGSAGSAAPRSRFIEVPDSPGGVGRIRLDTDLYLPARLPAPAVLLAHGFGQDKSALAPEAQRLRSEGYVVLAYSARGFGRSTGRIGLDSLDGEVPDARALVDVLDRDPAVLHRGGDPVVGVVGASYGGALALMLGATDPRIDSVVAGITWNDLAQALDPVSAGWLRGSPRGAPRARLFKAAWTSRLLGTGAAGSSDPCSRFTARLCGIYRSLVTGGALTDADLALLQRSSPSTVLGGMTAPTLLLQGLQDSLFGLDQADENRRQIRAAGATARVEWFDGGHDGDGVAGTERATDDWLDATLRRGDVPSRRFEYDVPASATSFPEHHVMTRYPGLFGTVRPDLVRLDGAEQTVVNPPGGQPASVTSLPGVGVDSDVGIAANGVLAPRNPPGQAARFVSSVLPAPVVLVGGAGVRVRIMPITAAAQDVVLFAQATALTGSISRTLPGGVAPIRLRVPEGGGTVYVSLPATTWRLAAGDRIAVTFRTTDSQFIGSTTPAAFRLSADAMLLPRLTTRSGSGGIGQPGRAVLDRIGVLLAVALLLILAAVVVGRLRRRAARSMEEGAAHPLDPAPPLRVRGVTKRFRSGFVAVDDVSFTVQRGQIVGLLGENGAGKTTTMRMLLGLARPDSGTIEAFGADVVPGAPVLRRIGCFIEGPGFLPHLSGRRNLRLFWAATGRPRKDARLEEVLAVADLGPAVLRRVGGYSQGMRQRLALAQAMLGMPDLLVLDEPTNGLDPSQIVALRGVLRRYADGGRTVVVSSHLLAEVERTCSHLVVMSHGRVVAAGPVDDLAGGTDELLLEVDDQAAAITAVDALAVQRVEASGSTAIRVLPGAVRTADVIAAVVGAGVGVADLRRERHLEEAFLDLVRDGGSER
ncbi:alpha/beta fold hydrolase [uncultured Amnibacterium sp.]|uniref:alpha/beta fold hydrolase n=1 Tax=uncultured Amnibacterium sp. TaxID=1631851 RepID=UPI0035C9C93A